MYTWKPLVRVIHVNYSDEEERTYVVEFERIFRTEKEREEFFADLCGVRKELVSGFCTGGYPFIINENSYISDKFKEEISYDGCRFGEVYEIYEDAIQIEVDDK